MFTARHNTFETNSSSTHSIVIPKNVDVNKYPKHLFYFDLGEYSWTRDVVHAPSYLYTAIYVCFLQNYHNDKDKEKGQEYIEKIKTILDKNNFRYQFVIPREKDDPYIDHHNELRDFIEQVCNNEDLLLRYLLFGEVYTGNDNTDYDESYHYFDAYYKVDPDNYDYFYKGN